MSRLDQKTPTRYGWALLLLSGVLCFGWACLLPPLEVVFSGKTDGATDAEPPLEDGHTPGVLGLFTVSGCQKLTFPDAGPLCEGPVPLTVELVPLPVGVTSYRWQVAPSVSAGDGGTTDAGTGSILDEAQSKSRNPQLSLKKPGDYVVSLAVSGPGGTSHQAGRIVVLAQDLGAVCETDAQCQSGLRCLCSQGGSPCPGSLAKGLCTTGCDGIACPAGSVCLNLSRSQTTVPDGGVGDAYRQPICVRPCAQATDCRADQLCRVLPLSQPGAPAGAPLAFGPVCFASLLATVGESCIGADEQPSARDCATGQCEPLGARHLCTHACGVCPQNAACATWNSNVLPSPKTPSCLARCDDTKPCSDPLLDCLPGGGSGGLGFVLSGESPQARVCAPRRCVKTQDCPLGKCVAVGASSFCFR